MEVIGDGPGHPTRPALHPLEVAPHTPPVPVRQLTLALWDERSCSACQEIPMTSAPLPCTHRAMVVGDIGDGDVTPHCHVGDGGGWQAVLEAAPVLLVNGQLKGWTEQEPGIDMDGNVAICAPSCLKVDMEPWVEKEICTTDAHLHEEGGKRQATHCSALSCISTSTETKQPGRNPRSRSRTADVAPSLTGSSLWDTRASRRSCSEGWEVKFEVIYEDAQNQEIVTLSDRDATEEHKESR
ncbi:hypothetical protein E2C01_013759 [Portunus trituberculatus]|uniref:Uncharacterized protein n=1 Tax=Portunus trituberculatus TaxID=210409 RepID=A0A5B7DHH7_PORTR|nr:hypothetical protein [Portunus trituberculatus]